MASVTPTGINKPIQHTLALKVLRLTNPTLMMSTRIPIGDDDLDELTIAIDASTQGDIVSDTDIRDFALGEFLTLPQSFGKIYLGETFSSYVSVKNTGQERCTDFKLTADVSTKSKTITMNQQASNNSLEPGERVDNVYHYEIKELGKHVLICSLEYADASGPHSFKKQFRFEVKVPLAVTHEFYSAEDNCLYLKAEVSNVTCQPIFISHVKLLQSPHYSVTPMSHDRNGSSIFESKDYLDTSDKRVYLYRLTPTSDQDKSIQHVSNSLEMGRLDIVWRTNFGEKGHLQTSPLERQTAGYGDLRVKYDLLNATKVKLGEDFPVNIKLLNCCNRNMEITLDFLNIALSTSLNYGLLWCGLSGQKYCLSSYQTIALNLQMTAVKAGLQTINGIRLTEHKQARNYEFDDIANVFVYN